MSSRLAVSIWFDALMLDLRYAIRGLRWRPGFAAMVSITFAIGIGANATMFGVVDHLLLRAPAHIADPDRLVQIRSRRLGSTSVQSTQNYAIYKDLRDNVSDFENVAVATPAYLVNKTFYPLGRGVTATRVGGSLVSASFFRTLGVRPALGRFFGPDEDNETAPKKVAVISWGFWQRYFGGKPTAVGAPLDIGTSRYVVVGITPKGFRGTEFTDIDVWLPITAAEELRFDRSSNWTRNRNATWMNVFARLRPSVNAEHARAQATAAFRAGEAIRIAELTRPTTDSPDSMTVVFSSVIPGRSIGSFGVTATSPEVKVTKLLAGVAILVLVIACANIANLLLARAVSRRREIAVRLALGVSRTRLIGQLVMEGVVLALIGAAGAMLVALFGAQIIRRWLFGEAAWTGGGVNGRVLAFTAVAAIVTGILTSLLPAIQTSRPVLTTALKAGSREGGVQRSRTRDILLVAQAALAIVLLAGAGLFVRSLRKVAEQPLGVDIDRVLVASISHGSVGLRNGQALELYLEFARRASAIPGISASAVSIGLPFDLSWGTRVSVPGRTLPRLKQGPVQYAVTSDYFTVLGIPLIAGRKFRESDGPSSERVVIINQTMARLYWPNQNPIGQCMRIGADTMPCSTIVGIVANTHRQDLVEGLVPQLYRPLIQLSASITDGIASSFGFTLVARTPGDPARLVEPLRRTIQSTSAIVPYANVRPMDDLLGRHTRSWRLGAQAFSVFGLVALVLAVVGLYSVVTFTVAQRLHEFGVRIALGAQATDITRLTMNRGVAPIAVGVAIGIVLALLAGKLVASLLFQVSPHDPGVLASVSGILLVAAALASLVPAVRATRADPMVALRVE
jgi:predicted permease